MTEMTIDMAYSEFKKRGFKNQRDCFKKGVSFGVEIGKQMVVNQNAEKENDEKTKK